MLLTTRFVINSPGGSGNGSHSPNSGWRSSNEHYASDDVEDETRGMEAALSGSHLGTSPFMSVTDVL